MSMPHTCRCGICGAEMSPMFVQTGLTNGTAPFQTVGSKPVEYSKSQHAVKVETYRVVAAGDTGAKE